MPTDKTSSSAILVSESIESKPLEPLAAPVPPVKSSSPFLTETGEPRYWIIYYRYGNIPLAQKGFRFDGKLEQAIIRARKHCEIMQLTFLLVRPLIVDLDWQETQFIQGKYGGRE